jgi:hypothetical protein
MESGNVTPYIEWHKGNSNHTNMNKSALKNRIGPHPSRFFFYPPYVLETGPAPSLDDQVIQQDSHSG